MIQTLMNSSHSFENQRSENISKFKLLNAFVKFLPLPTDFTSASEAIRSIKFTPRKHLPNGSYFLSAASKSPSKKIAVRGFFLLFALLSKCRKEEPAGKRGKPKKKTVKRLPRDNSRKSYEYI